MAKPVTLLYFAQFREIFGCSQETLDLPDNVATLNDLVEFLCQRGGVWQEQLGGDKAFRAAINQDMVEVTATIPAYAEIALFKPVTGG